MSHEIANGYGTRPNARPGIGELKRRHFTCNWVETDDEGNERVCSVAFDSTSPNAEVCPRHRRARDLERNRRQAAARRKAVGG